MKHVRFILPVLLILAVVTLACGLGRGEVSLPQATEAPTVEGQPPVTEAAPEPTEAPVVETGQPPATGTAPEPTEAVPEPPEEPVEGDEGDTEEAELDLNSSMSSLDNLNSYRATFRFDWNGARDGEPVTGYMQMRSAFVREPPAQELHFKGQSTEGGEDQGLGEVSFIQVDDTAWFYEGESDQWMQVPAGSLDFSEGLFFRPEDLLNNFDIEKARRSVLPTERNGVPCYVHFFDERDFDLTDAQEGDAVVRAEGEVCVAVDGDYVVQMVVDADFRYTNPDQVFDEGNIRMSLDISDVNQPITIDLPAEAEAQATGRQDIPMLPDADVEFATAEFITYKTASSVEEAAGFYQDAMPANGWMAEESNMIMADTAILTYNKGTESASIVIGADENGTNVMVSVGPQ